MLGKTHIIFGVLFALPLYLGFGNGNLVFFGSAIFGSLLPDIDHPRAFISTLNPLTQFLSRHIYGGLGHRGIFHSLFAAIIFFFVATLLVLYFKGSILYSLFFFIGYISHLAADSLNPSGIQWLRPFGGGKTRWTIRTGSKEENVVFVLILLFLVFIGLKHMGFF